jgi:hypothetical protein
MNRYCAPLALVAFFACGHAPHPEHPEAPQSATTTARPARKSPNGKSRPPTPAEQKVIHDLMARTERVRGLKFRAPVPVVIQDRAAITAYIETQIDDDSLERAKTLYAALGLLEADEDIRALLLRVLGEQILGYFDPKQKRLVVREDIMRSIPEGNGPGRNGVFDEARVALVHELVHALQCQHLGLSEHIDDKRDSDQDNAYRALVEGDASLAMIAYLLDLQQPGATLDRLTSDPLWVRSLSAMAEQLPLGEAELANAPEIVREPLLFAYIDGLAFASFLHGRGGWKAINQSFPKPPTSTKEILHPERYLEGPAPAAIRLPDLPSLSAAGYHVAQEDTLGELEMSIFFNQALDQEAAERATAGWSGDRLRVYRNSAGVTPVVWFSAWESERQAEEAEQAATRVLRGQKQLAADQSRVVRQGRAVLILRLLPSALQAEPIEAFKRWILAQYSPRKENKGEFRTRSLGPVFYEYRGRSGQTFHLRPQAGRSSYRTGPHDSFNGL